MSWLSQWLKEIIMVILLATFIDLLLPNRSMQRYVKLMLSLIILLIILSPIMKLFHANLAQDVANEWTKATMLSSDAFTSLTSIQREAAKLTAERDIEAQQFAASQLGANMKDQVNQMLERTSWPVVSDSTGEDISAFIVTRDYFRIDEIKVELEQASLQTEPKIQTIRVFLNMSKNGNSRHAQSSVEEASKDSHAADVEPVQAVPDVQISTNEDPAKKEINSSQKLTKEASSQIMNEVEALVTKQLTTQWLVGAEQIHFVWEEKK